MAQSGLIGQMSTPIDMSYLADTILMFRYFEDRGRVRKAISVVKKRSGPHEDTIRELVIATGGIKIGRPLSELRGVLTGTPFTAKSPA
jgi:circadian clock protein KaiC